MKRGSEDRESPMTKGERREAKQRKRRKMRVHGTSVKLTQRMIRERGKNA
jgi:hypothetical protein